MKMFKYSLQKLLETKEAFEKACEVKLADVVRRLELQKRRLEELKTEMNRQAGNVQQMKGAQVSSQDLVLHQQYIARLEKNAEKQAELVATCVAAVEDVRRQLIALMRERKSLENLREREKKEWLLNGRRMELKEMDEVAVNGHLRLHKSAS